MKGIAMFHRVINGVSKGFYVASMVVTFSIAVLVFYNVILRYIFRKPTYWSVEVTSIMLVVVTFLAVAELSRQRRHIKFSLLLDRLPPGKHDMAEILTSVLGLIFCSALIWQGSMATHMVYAKNMCMPSLLGTPLFIPYLFLPLGAAILALQLLVRIVGDIQHLMKGQRSEH